jgi:hypothetical protein
VAGLEFDWFEQSHAVLAPHTENLPLDYRIGSVTLSAVRLRYRRVFLGVQDGGGDRTPSTPRIGDSSGMAESRLFDIAGHLDLPKKFGFHPKADLRGLEDEALDAIKRAA